MKSKIHSFSFSIDVSRLLTCFGLFLASLIIAEQAAASIVSYTQDRRSTLSSGSTGTGTGNFFDPDFPPAPYAAWTSTFQTSSMDGFSIAADGSGKGSRFNILGSTSTQSVTSTFDVTFSSPTALHISLSGLLSAVNTNAGLGPNDASVALYSGDNTLIENLLYGASVNPGMNTSENTVVDYSAFLGAGEYRLVAIAGGAGEPADIDYLIESSYALSASFSAVPLPAAVWLFGSGLLGLVHIARRKKS